MDETPPLFSVCIANFNGEDILADCLKSVLAQTIDARVEIIVHDDHSTDASLEVLARFPGVKVIASDTNVGFCVSNNRMAHAASGKFLLLLNNDAALYPDALATLWAQAQAHPGNVLTLPQYDWTSGELVDRGCLLDTFYNPVPNVYASRTDVAMTIGACLCIEASLWNELGGFPTWIESIAEDMYICCAARRMGRKVLASPSSGYRHRQGHSFGGNKATDGRLSTSFRRRKLSERNKTMLMAIFSPGWVVLPLLFVHMLLLLLEGMALTLTKRDGRVMKDIYLHAITSSWRMRKLAMDERRAARARGTSPLRGYYSAFTWVPRKWILFRSYGIPEVR
ncbi:glycosyltransferase family 2 protein [Pinirhizobacter soli]|uniref:glycosyltransferase family 2 protein n=1 Tax=Pinirhizobacter soli TaxID=2786953 RepID=UPI002029CAB7|nr:glycosyltransferase [Pinirhizobacter soli]